MPELPEVETVVRFLQPLLEKKTISDVQINSSPTSLIVSHSTAAFKKLVSGQQVKRVSRRGKFIVISLETGFFLIHLRMTGRLLLHIPGNENHLRAQIHLSSGTVLDYKDQRKFGRFYYSENLYWLENKLGVEPFSDAFTAPWFYRALKKRKRMMKPLLLDQKFIAGLGNIYVDEALWAARIHPETSSRRIGRPKVFNLHRAIRDVLFQAIENEGTTIINFQYGAGNTGSFLEKLRVFGRAGKPCPLCGTEIRKKFVAQRGTHFCPRCQRCYR